MVYGQIRTGSGRTLNLTPDQGWTNGAGEQLVPNSGGSVNTLSDMLQRHSMNANNPVDVFGKGRGYMDSNGIVRGMDPQGQEWSVTPGVDMEKTRELQKFNMDLAAKQQSIDHSRADIESGRIRNKLLEAQLADMQGGPESAPGRIMAPALGVPAAPADPLNGLSRKAREQFQTKMYTSGDKQVSETEQDARTAQQFGQDAKRFQELNKTTTTGPLMGGGPIGFVRKIGNSDLQEMDALSSKLIPKMREPGSGNTSDFDARMLAKATIGIDKDKKANDSIALGMIAKSQQDQDRSSFLRTYLEGNGTLRGADQAWSKYINANPIFDPQNERVISLNRNRVHWRQFFNGNQGDAQQPVNPSGQSRPPLSSFER